MITNMCMSVGILYIYICFLPQWFHRVTISTACSSKRFLLSAVNRHYINKWFYFIMWEAVKPVLPLVAEWSSPHDIACQHYRQLCTSLGDCTCVQHVKCITQCKLFQHRSTGEVDQATELNDSMYPNQTKNTTKQNKQTQATGKQKTGKQEKTNKSQQAGKNENRHKDRDTNRFGNPWAISARLSHKRRAYGRSSQLSKLTASIVKRLRNGEGWPRIWELPVTSKWMRRSR